MANKTINDLTATTTAAAGDFVPIWVAATNVTRKITKANFMGGVITGGGTVATGGFTLTATGTSTINGSLVGNITGGGTIATGGNTLTVSGAANVAGTLSGGGTVATGGFTLTVPATGTAMLLGGAQTVSGTKTFTAAQVIDPATAASSAFTINMPSHTTGVYNLVVQNQGVDRIYVAARNSVTNIGVLSVDLGANIAGPSVTIGNNTNATGVGPGTLRLTSGNGTIYNLFVTNAGVLRIHTAQPTTSEAVGTVVGTQT